MQQQIRINVTPTIRLAFVTLRRKKYFTMSDSEIIKYLLAKDLETLNKEQNLDIDAFQNLASEAFELDDPSQDLYSKKDLKK